MKGIHKSSIFYRLKQQLTTPFLIQLCSHYFSFFHGLRSKV